MEAKMATPPKKPAARKTAPKKPAVEPEVPEMEAGSESTETGADMGADNTDKENSRIGEAVRDFTNPKERNIWMRGLIMILFAVFIYIAQSLLGIAAIIQFLWMLISKEPNSAIAKFGVSLGNWLAHAAQFQAGATEKLPFPWSDWE